MPAAAVTLKPSLTADLEIDLRCEEQIGIRGGVVGGVGNPRHHARR